MLKNSSGTLHFSAAYCSSFAKQYSEYRSLPAYCCSSIYKLMKLASNKNFVHALSLNSGKGYFVKKFLAKQQIQISKCLPVDTLQKNDLPCTKFAVTSSSISCCFVCDLLASLSHSSLMAEQPAPKRDLCAKSGEGTLGSKNLSPPVLSFQGHWIFFYLRVHSKKITHTRVILAKKKD